MPTKQGSIWAQFVQGTFASNADFTFSVHPNSRDITAYSSINRYDFFTPGHSWSANVPPHLFVAFAGISRVVSSGVTENFNTPLQFVKRNNVTEIRFRTFAGDVSIHAVHIINYWE